MPDSKSLIQAVDDTIINSARRHAKNGDLKKVQQLLDMATLSTTREIIKKIIKEHK